MATDDFYRTGSEPVMPSSLGSEEKGKEKDKGKKWTLRRRSKDEKKLKGTPRVRCLRVCGTHIPHPSFTCAVQLRLV